MEVVGALASSLQLVGQCGLVTMTIIKWVDSVRTVDQRIDSFVREINALRATYESLSNSLKDPSMLEAARITNRDVGGHLWTQMSHTLRDCEKTIVKITNVLRRIHASSNFLRPVLKQLREQLYGGELARLREQVTMFNSSLQLPMQMITLTLQLRQQEITTAHQLQLNDQLTSLRTAIQRIENLSKGVITPRRQVSFGGSTLAGDSSADDALYRNMDTYVETAKKFLDSASVAASTLSAASTTHHDEASPPALALRRGSAFAPLTEQKLQSMWAFVDDVRQGSGADNSLASDGQPLTESLRDAAEDSDEDDDTDLHLLMVMLRNGQSAYGTGDLDTAEDNFREALAVSQSHDFGSKIACSTADITLLLSECLVKQAKHDEAIVLLQPLTSQLASSSMESSSSVATPVTDTIIACDKGQALSASHLLGQVYLQKSDYIHAEIHAVQAFRGRKKLLGESHAKTLDSVVLVIDMYKAKGQNARAEAYRDFLKPASTDSANSTPSNPSVSFDAIIPRAQPFAVPIGSPPKQRRATFNISSPFRRHERIETASTSVPMNRTANLSGNGSSPLGANDGNCLSSSAYDTLPLHMGPDIRPIDRSLRVDSSNSNGSYWQLRRWSTHSDAAESTKNEHRSNSNSLCRAPALYASLSRSEMEQIFTEVADLCKDGKTSKAIDKGISFLQRYDSESVILLHRTDELKENIKKSKGKGLAGTTSGFSALHFFCSLHYEALVEVDILLQHGADPNGLAYKAGWGPRKEDPFTPLSLAVRRGHEDVVRMLLAKGATWTSDMVKSHPLLQAASRGFVGIVEQLLESGMTLTEDSFPRTSWHGNSLLHEACFYCDLKLVKFLMSFARRNAILNNTSYSFVGRPGQQDVFGMTPIMSAVDMRDTKDQNLTAHKQRNQVACLKLLLGSSDEIDVQETDSGEVMVDHPEAGSPGRLAVDLHVQDKKGNSVYWYAEDCRGGGAELRAYLDDMIRRSRLIDI